MDWIGHLVRASLGLLFQAFSLLSFVILYAREVDLFGEPQQKSSNATFISFIWENLAPGTSIKVKVPMTISKIKSVLLDHDILLTEKNLYPKIFT